jgi:hypothetical protein
MVAGNPRPVTNQHLIIDAAAHPECERLERNFSGIEAADLK